MIRYQVIRRIGVNRYEIRLYQKQDYPIELVIEDDDRELHLTVGEIYESAVKLSIEFDGIISKDTVRMRLITKQVKEQKIHKCLKPFIKVSGTVTASTKGKKPNTQYIRIKLDESMLSGVNDPSSTLSVYIGEELTSNLNLEVGDRVDDMDVKLHTIGPHRIVGVFVQQKIEEGAVKND